jgi:ATP-dependent Clp protease ATP-binding subunit ClpA
MLTPKDVYRIAEIQLGELKHRLAEKNIELSVTQAAIEKISELGYQPQFGARPLKRAIQEYIGSPISKFILANPEKRAISVAVKNGQFIIS